MDPRFTTVAPDPMHLGINLRCEDCKESILDWHFSGDGDSNERQSVFELVRESLRHSCKE